MDLTTATPSEIDTLWNEAAVAQRDALSRVAMSVLTYEETRGGRTRRSSTTDYVKAADSIRMSASDLLDRADALVDACAAADSDYAEVRMPWQPERDRGYTAYQGRDPKFAAAIDAARAAADTLAECDAEWNRRGGWARYYIVVSSKNGKTHRAGCGSWRWSTRVSLAAEVSGNDDENVVATLDAQACTRCFPDAPTA